MVNKIKASYITAKCTAMVPTYLRINLTSSSLCTCMTQLLMRQRTTLKKTAEFKLSLKTIVQRFGTIPTIFRTIPEKSKCLLNNFNIRPVQVAGNSIKLQQKFRSHICMSHLLLLPSLTRLLSANTFAQCYMNLLNIFHTFS